VIVVDTNVLISAILVPGSVPDLVLASVFAARALVVSPQQVDEIADVLTRPKILKRVNIETVERILHLLRTVPTVCIPRTRVIDCRDPKDNMILEIALEAGATLIISGDGDLLDLHPWRGHAIVTPRAYLDSLAT